MVDVKEKLKSYESDVRHRVQCQEKAFRIVNKLIDDAVAQSYLVDCVCLPWFKSDPPENCHLTVKKLPKT